ncbi:MAG: signal peptidase I [Acidimicrobiales bacterium]
MRRGLVELAILVAIAASLAFVLKSFVAQAYSIPSESMEPQLEVGDRVVVSKVAYALHDPNRGDIVVFASPERRAPSDDNPVVGFFNDVAEGVGLKPPDDDVLIKRVIALPGETVAGHDGHVFIDGRELVEPYLPSTEVTEDFPSTLVPDDRVWVMGDNRDNSRDSHIFGPVAESAIVGRAIAKVWPPLSTSFL